MNGYFLFILLVIIVILFCIACTIGLRVRRRRIAASAAAEQRYSQFVNQNDNMQEVGQNGNYANVYYQQQQQPQVGLVSGTGGGGLYYPTGAIPNSTGNPSGRPAMPATVLYVAPPGSEANTNFGNYFPEAQVVSTSSNNNNGYDSNDVFGVSSPSEASPYGEANYLSRPPPPPQSHMQQPQSTVSPSVPGPVSPGVASLPPPQYPALSTRPTSGDSYGDQANKQRKKLD